MNKNVCVCVCCYQTCVGEQKKNISNRVDQLQKKISPLIPIRFSLQGQKFTYNRTKNDEGYAFQLYNYSAIEIILFHLSLTFFFYLANQLPLHWVRDREKKEHQKIENNWFQLGKLSSSSLYTESFTKKNSFTSSWE